MASVCQTETEMGTYTTNYQLYMPTVGETGWGTLVNGNYQTIDTTMKGLSNRIAAVENEVNGNLSCTSVTTSGKVTANGGISTKALTGTTGTFSGTVTGNKLIVSASKTGVIKYMDADIRRYIGENVTSIDISSYVVSTGSIIPQNAFMTVIARTESSGTRVLNIGINGKTYSYTVTGTTNQTYASDVNVAFPTSLTMTSPSNGVGMTVEISFVSYL